MDMADIQAPVKGFAIIEKPMLRRINTQNLGLCSDRRGRDLDQFVTVATCTGSPLLRVSVLTTAVRRPGKVGLVENVTISEVGVAAITVPTAPSLKATLLLLA